MFEEDKEVQTKTAFPPTSGEFAYFPDMYAVKDNRLFDIARFAVINPQTKEVKIDFASHNPYQEGQFEYFAMLHPGQTFVSHCLGGDSKTAHVVEYTDIFRMDNSTYVEFWGTHVTMPNQLLPCSMPDLIRHSLPLDMSLRISFDSEE